MLDNAPFSVSQNNSNVRSWQLALITHASIFILESGYKSLYLLIRSVEIDFE